MIATGFLSMWVSNNATTVMMIPIGVSVLILVAQVSSNIGIKDDANPEDESAKQAVIKSNFGTALMLGIAYATSLDSLGTLIGTPPNTLLAGYMSDTHGVESVLVSG